MPPSDVEPPDCVINKLRIMGDDERKNKISKMTFIEQLKLARIHKICTLIRCKKRCILADE